MKYRTLGEYGDYTFGKKLFLRDREAVGQAIITRMKLLYSEWWENTEDGLPLFERILGVFISDQHKNAIDLIISNRISGTHGVKNIVKFESDFRNRIYTAQCVINTIYGEVTLSIYDSAKRIEVSY